MASELTTQYTINRASVGGTSGLAVIFAFEFFTKDSERREGTEREIENLEHFYDQINLRVHVLRNLDLEMMELALNVITCPDKYKRKYKEIPAEIWNARLRQEDCISFIALTSHGNNTSFQLKDGKQMLDLELEKYFYENNCSILRGCPKLFLYNKCRNYPNVDNSFEIAYELGSLTSAIVTDGLGRPSNRVTIPDLHMMSIYTCPEGVKSLRSISEGSLILSELPGAYERYGQGKCLVEFFTDFLNAVGTYIGLKMETVGSADYPVNITQIPSMERNTLRYPLYFLEPKPKCVTMVTREELGKTGHLATDSLASTIRGSYNPRYKRSTLPVRAKSHAVNQDAPYTTERGKVKKSSKK